MCFMQMRMHRTNWMLVSILEFFKYSRGHNIQSITKSIKWEFRRWKGWLFRGKSIKQWYIFSHWKCQLDQIDKLLKLPQFAAHSNTCNFSPKSHANLHAIYLHCTGWGLVFTRGYQKQAITMSCVCISNAILFPALNAHSSLDTDLTFNFAPPPPPIDMSLLWLALKIDSLIKYLWMDTKSGRNAVHVGRSTG